MFDWRFGYVGVLVDDQSVECLAGKLFLGPAESLGPRVLPRLVFLRDLKTLHISNARWRQALFSGQSSQAEEINEAYFLPLEGH